MTFLVPFIFHVILIMNHMKWLRHIYHWSTLSEGRIWNWNDASLVIITRPSRKIQVNISFEYLLPRNRACSPCCTFYEKKSLFSLERHMQFNEHWKWTNFHQLIRIPTNSQSTEMTDVLSSCGDRPKFRLCFFWYFELADNFKIEWMKFVFLVLVNIEMFVKINSSFFDKISEMM